MTKMKKKLDILKYILLCVLEKFRLIANVIK